MPNESIWDEALCRRYADSMRKLARYDHRGVATRIARHLGGLRPRATVVEVASGPGFLAIELGRLLTEPTLVLVDSAKPMLSIAEEEARRAGVPVRTIESSGDRIALPDASADVVLCKNLMNCIDASQRIDVAREIARLLAPGGWAFVADFDVAGSRLAATLIGLFTRFLVGAEFHRDFRAAFARRLDPGPLAAVLAEAGCSTSIERSGPSFLLVARRAQA
ncbi:MAG: class I SAM-dependent methyltransferase [Deltaproteobacteria bacterium]|nr:class I SAM-dependent methyltransferase [Deltaproteobacteria bacterium]